MNRHKLIKIKAFTLSEVLLVLSVIGVISAITIPGLISKITDQLYETRLKKFYSTFNEAIKKATADSDCANDVICAGIYSHSDDYAENIMLKYLNKSKDLGYYNNAFTNVIDYYEGSGTPHCINPDGYNRHIILTDGTIVGIEPANTLDCAENHSISGKGPMSRYCGFIYVDINGQTPPNRYGKDIFWFHLINSDGVFLYPYGGADDNIYGYWKSKGTCTPTDKSGTYCTARIMEEGWRMNY